jgi:hypothetical protein
MLKYKSIKYLLFFILTCLILTSCGSPGVLSTPTPTALAGGGEPDQIQLSCPEEDTLFSLWFSHFAVLDIDAGDGETFYLEFENIPPSYFDLWILPDGTISNDGIFREAPVGYHGAANHPNDDDCPVQTFDGITQMRATITGTCANDRVQIHIVEEWIDPTLNSDCGSAIGPGPGLYSAPELDLVFDLNDQYPSDVVQIPEGGPFHATYAYYLWLAGYELPIVPLVPERE